MTKKIKISLFEMMLTLSTVIDFMSVEMNNHQIRVAYIAYRIGEEMGLPEEQLVDMIMASLIHDIGALSLQERLDTFHFEIKNPYQHAEIGYRLVKQFEPLKKIAKIIRYHHENWRESGKTLSGEDIPIESYIIHLADRVEILIRKNEEILGQKDRILSKVLNSTTNTFHPQALETLKAVSEKEYFWLEAVSEFIQSILSKAITYPSIELALNNFDNMAKLFGQIIDFRSRFTATHSSGVAITSEMLGRLLDLSEETCKLLHIAGYLHDLGKLVIPLEILEKPGKLSKEEFNVIKSHSFYTYYILETFESLDEVRKWAAFHHERLNGAGYPFHINQDNISFESRIVGVADVFTALTEDRPYRQGMAKNAVLSILDEMGKKNELDQRIITCLIEHYDEINEIRRVTQQKVLKEYENFLYTGTRE
ncbi:MAG: HD domain-containing protein [Epulopiscium sp.]|nr:HD domain-containing protein [Candidatus Epulonipiscium sp.]